MFKKLGKHSVASLVALIMVFALPAMALACNWGAKATANCDQLTVTVDIARGNQEAAGTYHLYWSKDGDPKKGQEIASGEIPALKAGETHQIVYELKNNPNGKEGKYIFHLKEPRGSIWTDVLTVENCTKPDDGNNGEKPGDNTGTQPPSNGEKPGDNTGAQPPSNGEKPADNTGTQPPSNPGQPNQSQQPAATNPGGQMPKTATTYPVGMIAGFAILAIGTALVLKRRAF